MKTHSTGLTAVAVLTAMAYLAGCADSGSEDPNQPAEPTIELAFTPSSVSFGEERSGLVELQNTGDGAAGPVELAALELDEEEGEYIPGVSDEIALMVGVEGIRQ